MLKESRDYTYQSTEIIHTVGIYKGQAGLLTSILIPTRRESNQTLELSIATTKESSLAYQSTSIIRHKK